MGSGQSNIEKNQSQQNSTVLHSQLPTQIYQSQQTLKKRNIIDDDEDEDDDEEDDDIDSNEDSDDEFQNFSLSQDYIEGESFVQNKKITSVLLLNQNQISILKKVFLPKIENYKLINFSLQQLFSLQHQNINDVLSWNLETVRGQKKGYMVEIFTKFQFSCSLSQIIQKYCKFSLDLALYILKQILEGLQYLKQKNLLHKNLKSSNILIGEQGNVLLTDIQIFSSLPLSNYTAPETMLYSEYSEASDIWSVGCILYEILTKQPPWSIENRLLSLQEIKKKYSFYQTFLKEEYLQNQEVVQLLKQIFSYNPQERPTIDQLLNHKIFQESTQQKLKMVTKQLQMKGDQKKLTETNIKSLISNIQVKNVTQVQVKKEYVKFCQKENQEITDELNNVLQNILDNQFLEFTEKQNSKLYNLSKINFINLCQKQQKFSTTLIKKLNEINKTNQMSLENLAQLTSQVQTAANFHGQNQDSDHSINDKQFDNQSDLFNMNQYSDLKFSEQKQDFLQEQTNNSQNFEKQTQSIQIKDESQNQNNCKKDLNFDFQNFQEEKVIIDGDLLFIL